MHPDLSEKDKPPVNSQFMVKQVLIPGGSAVYLKCTAVSGVWVEDSAKATQLPYEVAKTMAAVIATRNKFVMPKDNILIFVVNFYEEQVYG